MTHPLKDRAAIVGIGQTEFSKNSGRSEMQLACEAVAAALADAGIDPAEVDGMCTYTHDANTEMEVFRNIGGRELHFWNRLHYGGGAACGVVLQAALAVAGGVADVVVCYRAMNERSEYRFGQGHIPQAQGRATYEQAHWSFVTTSGLFTPASWVGMQARRYMHQYGATSEDFGRATVISRQHAATNPAAWFYNRPITLEDHQASRMIADPLRMLDCCQESDGGVALVIVSAERARDLRHRPALIRAAAQGVVPNQEEMTEFQRDDMADSPDAQAVARQLWKMAGLQPSDIDVAILYDAFSPFVLFQLEAYGFVPRGEAKDFIRDGQIGLGGKLPTNTHGGLLGEGYIHGVNGILEAVRQIRGTSVNQVKGARHAIATGAVGTATSGIILAAP